MPQLQVGDPAPEISLPTDSGDPFTLSSLHGQNVILYFYPKADTPGCTKEACDFRDSSPRLSKANTVVVGVSPDTTNAQAKFKQKFDLPFSLLADVNHQAAEAYGVWKEKSMYGKKFMEWIAPPSSLLPTEPSGRSSPRSRWRATPRRSWLQSGKP